MTFKPQPVPPTRAPMPNEDLATPGPGGPGPAPASDLPTPRGASYMAAADGGGRAGAVPPDRTTSTHTATQPRDIPPEGLAHPEVTKTEARQGRTRGIVRYVLATSLVLAILAMVVVYAGVLG